MEKIYKPKEVKETDYLKMEIAIRKKYFNVAVEEITHATRGYRKPQLHIDF